ncbi:hypothetical protein BCR32DRAFT_329966 [Anaeromyces robustus]|uniref:Uncharacterized protein n=1 Tax=Anaeromyces robustus TaxID=1754192 RepID=A0A1Y1WNE7_9FUNG|nr:hypothetical protein BCR32DRAFT_329966 [Anaeromyces robustus]|eukprot:ORX75071.1 hypothetical protein BCR32DRAFT_329966 [Anaeromyces robustus]
MEIKKFILVLFILLSILSLAYAQDNPGDKEGDKDKETTTTPAKEPSNTTTDPANNTSTEPIKPDPTPTPMTPSNPNNSTVTVPPATSASPSTQPLLPTAIKKSSSTAPSPKQTTTTVVKKATSVQKKYPHSTIITWEGNDSTPAEDSLMTFLYGASVLIITVLVGLASFTLYKKGFGDENIQASRTWETSFDDNSFRNKSTISRNTLTPSVRNATLGSPNPNNSQYR